MKTLILVFIFTVNTIANPCNFAFMQNYSIKSAREVELTRSTFMLDGLTKGLKSIFKNSKDIGEDLIRGQSKLAIEKWTHTFRKVEVSTLRIENTKKMIDALSNRSINLNNGMESYLRSQNIPDYVIERHMVDLLGFGNKRYLKKLRRQYNKYSKVLGNNYDKYMSAKNQMNALLADDACSVKCKEAIQNVLDETSILKNQYSPHYANLTQNRSKIPQELVKDTFEVNSKSFVVAKRKQFINYMGKQIKDVFKNRYIIKDIFVGNKHSRLAKIDSVIRLFKRGFDHKYHQFHKTLITRISYSELSAAKKLEMLKRDIGKLDLDEVLTDFARTTEGKMQTSFDEMYEFVKSQPNMGQMQKRFEDAMELAKRLGKIGQRSPRNTDWIIGSLLVAGAGYVFFSYSTSDEDPEISISRGGVVVEGDSNGDEVQADEDSVQPPGGIDVTDEDGVIEVEFDSEEDKEILDTFIEIKDTIEKLAQ